MKEFEDVKLGRLAFISRTAMVKELLKVWSKIFEPRTETSKGMLRRQAFRRLRIVQKAPYSTSIVGIV